MKKPVRLLLLATGAFVVLALVALGLALHSGVQTWAVRRAIAGQPGLKARLGQLSAGFQNVDVADVHFEQDGAKIALPSLHAELSVVDAGMNRKINLRRLVAKGWTLDLTHFQPPAVGKKVVLLGAPGGSSRPFSLLPSAYAAEPSVPAPSPASSGTSASSAAPSSRLAPRVPASAAATAVNQVFQGIFASTELPFELALDGVDLEGDVLLPPSPDVTSGRAHVTVVGGGFASGHEGALTVTVAVALTGPQLPVDSVNVQSRLTATMDTPRTFTRLSAKTEAAATGPQFPRAVRLTAESIATRDAAGENYTLTLAGDGRPLVAVRGSLPKASRKLDGTWTLDLADADLTPFALGFPLPAFTANGSGRFETDPSAGEARVTGKLDATADKLAAYRPEFAAVGAVRLAASFDLARRGDAVRVERLALALSGARPVLHAEALQPFEFNPKNGELKVADPARALLGLVFDGVPLAWAGRLLPGYAVTGGDLRGAFLATAREGGVTLRPSGPLTAAGVSVSQGQRQLLRGVDLAVAAAADYTPQGWQLELSPLAVTGAGQNILTVEAKAGRLAGRDQPLKAAGRFSSHLPAVLGQPAAAGAAALVRGELVGSFVATLDAQQDLELSVTFSDLAADPKLTAQTLPSLTATVRATFAPKGGPITVRAPLLLEREGRKSDLTLVGTLTPTPGNLIVNAQLSSSSLVVDDALLLLPIAPPAGPDAAVPAAPAAPAPHLPVAPWAGVSGQVSLALKKVIYSDLFVAADVTGTLRIDAGMVRLEDVRAGLADGCDAKLAGSLGFDVESSEPFTLAADVVVNEFNPAPLFRSLNPGQPATVEGKFSVTTKLAGQAPTLADLAATARGDLLLTSKGGVFRGLPVGIAAKAESTSKLAAGAAMVGNLINSVTGKKETSDIASKAQAVSDICKLLSPIAYDQLSVSVNRDASLNTVLKDFTLIAPELRLSGGGLITHQPGANLLAESLALDLKLRARGHSAELFKYLGKLEAQVDDLGYAACTLPLRIAGTLDHPDTSDLRTALTALLVEKSGASDLLNKLLGGSK